MKGHCKIGLILVFLLSMLLYSACSGAEELTSGPVMLRTSDTVISGQTIFPFVTTTGMAAYPNPQTIGSDLDFSFIANAKAFVYGNGYDHADILMNGGDYSFSWNGIFPDNTQAPQGWYYLTIESIDIFGNLSNFTARIYAQGPIRVVTPLPEYRMVSFKGILNDLRQNIATVNGEAYQVVASSRIQPGLVQGDNVIGTALLYSERDILAVSEMSKVQEETASFSGLVNDISSDYAIVDRRNYEINEFTKWYCRDTRIGDYVSGIALIDDLGRVRIKEFGPVSCIRQDTEREDTGIIRN